MRVLFAGLNQGFIKALRFHLSKHENDLKIVNNGIGCMFTLKNHSIDLLVIEEELHWGGSDGVLSLMRDDPGLQHIPAVLLMPRIDNNRQCSNSKSRIRINKPSYLGDMLRIATFLDNRDDSDDPISPMWFFHAPGQKSFYVPTEGRRQIQFVNLYQKH